MPGNSALIIVDVQNDFCEGGALAVPESDAMIAPLNRAIEHAVATQVPLIVTRDWHPRDHSSFTTEGGIWPVHCVVGTPGAEFSEALRLPEGDGVEVFSKGTSRDGDGYSPFEGGQLNDRLKELSVDTVVVAGLATDYCVRAAVLDALEHGFAAIVLEDATRGVDLEDGDVTRAIDDMRGAGARFVTVDAWVSQVAPS